MCERIVPRARACGRNSSVKRYASYRPFQRENVRKSQGASPTDEDVSTTCSASYRGVLLCKHRNISVYSLYAILSAIQQPMVITYSKEVT